MDEIERLIVELDGASDYGDVFGTVPGREVRELGRLIDRAARALRAAGEMRDFADGLVHYPAAPPYPDGPCLEHDDHAELRRVTAAFDAAVREEADGD